MEEKPVSAFEQLAAGPGGSIMDLIDLQKAMEDHPTPCSVFLVIVLVIGLILVFKGQRCFKYLISLITFIVAGLGPLIWIGVPDQFSIFIYFLSLHAMS